MTVMGGAIRTGPALATYRELPVVVELTGTHTCGETLAGLGTFVASARIACTIDPTRRPVKNAQTFRADEILKRMLDPLA